MINDDIDLDLNEHLLDLDPDIHYFDTTCSENQNFSTFESIDDFFSENVSLNDCPNTLSIFCQNIRSFERNLDIFLGLFPHDKMPDIFIFSETWHRENRPLNIPGFIGYHTIRNGRAGGVSIFIKSQFSSSMISKFSYANENIEICTVKVCTTSENLHVSGIYRPQSATINDFNISLENIIADNEFPNSSSVLAGDFNVNLMSSNGDVERMVDIMRSHHYLQTVLSITHPGVQSSSSLIDLIWINQLYVAI